jgi:hypothetical protein
MQSLSSTTEIKGKIVRWTDANWGIANFYANGEQNPRKTFIHGSKVIAGKASVGAFVIFDLGPARSATELPAAFNVRVITTVEAI